MITGHVFIAVSLDGFIARQNGDIDWLTNYSAEDEDYGYDDFIASVDGLIMGRGTFEKVLSFDSWPYQKPVIVMSQTLKNADIPPSLSDKVRVSRLSPQALMDELESEGWRRAYVDGGKVIQSFLAAGLIDEMVLTRLPVLIGEGRPLFGSTPRDIKLEHLETKTFASGLVSSRYRLAKDQET